MNRRAELKIIIQKLISNINDTNLKTIEVTGNLSNYHLFLENVELLKKYQEEFHSLI